MLLKRAALLALLVAVAGCDSADPPATTLRLTGTYEIDVDSLGFEGSADGFYHPPATPEDETAQTVGLSDIGPTFGLNSRNLRLDVSLTTTTLAPGRYGIAPTEIEIDSLGGCNATTLYTPGTAALTLIVYRTDRFTCHPAVLTGTVDVVSAEADDVRFTFDVEAAPVGLADTLAVRGRFALRSAGSLGSDD